MSNNERILKIAQKRLNEIVNDAISELGEWDDLIEDEEISYEDFSFIATNLVVEPIKVSFKE